MTKASTKKGYSNTLVAAKSTPAIGKAPSNNSIITASAPKTAVAKAVSIDNSMSNVPVAAPTGASIASAVTGNKSITPQTGGTGNASINPYTNAYTAYQTAMGKVKNAQIGQLNTEYNNQQKQIEGNYQNLGRNAYVTYMQRAKGNDQAVSNMGANRTGMAENMRTANAVDYNRSIGNAGAYRQAQLSNAENAYNSSVAGVENEYATNMANSENQYRQLEINRQNELADLQQQLDFQASENAKDRAQQAKEADRAYQQQVLEYQDQKNQTEFTNWYNTVDKYTSKKQVDKAISALEKAKKSGTLNKWQTAYYSTMIDTLKIKKSTLKK